VGTATGLIHIYDIASHQLLRTISAHKGMSISHLTTMLKPPDLVGHISLSLNLGSSADAKDIIPMRPIVPFHRMKDSKAREAHEVAMMLPVQDKAGFSSIEMGILLMLMFASKDPRRHTKRLRLSRS
jgi:pre-rRNA-processing protein IPI3